MFIVIKNSGGWLKITLNLNFDRETLVLALPKNVDTNSIFLTKQSTTNVSVPMKKQRC